MRRREFVVGLGSAAAGPVLARAQQPASAPNPRMMITRTSPFRFFQGHVEGQNVTIEYRWAVNR
jgi:hypothetical protein